MNKKHSYNKLEQFLNDNNLYINTIFVNDGFCSFIEIYSPDNTEYLLIYRSSQFYINPPDNTTGIKIYNIEYIDDDKLNNLLNDDNASYEDTIKLDFIEKDNIEENKLIQNNYNKQIKLNNKTIDLLNDIKKQLERFDNLVKNLSYKFAIWRNQYLAAIKKDDFIEEYLKFWTNFGAALKEGLCEATTEPEKLLEVCMFRSSIHNKMISFDEYINNCKEDQKTIYYLSGEDSKKLLTSPQIEGFLNKGIDVLLFTDAVDNFWVNTNSKYKDYEIKSVTKSNIDLENSADEKANSEETKNAKEKKIKKDDDKYSKLLECFKQVLGNLVKDVKISKKLTTSLACLTVADNAMDFQMERLLAEHKKSFAGSMKILELNPQHKIIKKINNDLKLENNNSINDNENLIKLIFDQACIIEGEAVHDTVDFAKRFDDILEKVILLTPTVFKDSILVTGLTKVYQYGFGN